MILKFACYVQQAISLKVKKTFPPQKIQSFCFSKDSSQSLSLMLRPTVSLPVCLGTKHPLGAYDQILIIVWQLRVCWFGPPSLTRGRVCRLQLLLVLASAFIFGSEFRRTRGHILLSRLNFESYSPVALSKDCIFTILYNLVLYCHMRECDCRWGLDWRLDLLNTYIHTTHNYT
jgi:hypothetical protein